MKWFWNLISNEQLKLDNEALVAENRLLKAEMFNKGHLFFTNNQWLGYPRTIHGVIVDGKTIAISETIEGGFVNNE